MKKIEKINKIESTNLEFKESFSDGTLKSICAFSNTDGGTILIGVRDDGSVKGLTITNSTLENITNKIIDSLGVSPSIGIEKHKKLEIIKIEVLRSSIPISFNGKYYKRVGNTNREMTREELKRYFLKDSSWDRIISDFKISEIDEKILRNFINKAKETGRLKIIDENNTIKNVLTHLNLQISGKLTNASIMLFGKDPQKHFSNAKLRISRLKNETTITGDRIITGNLFKMLSEGEEAIKNFINVRYEINEMKREEVWDYPLVAIREALINSLIHRNYFNFNIPIQIKIYDDRIWIYNPGGLPDGISYEALFEPHPSIARNPLLVDIFYLSGFIEALGTGISRIRESLSKAGLPEPEIKIEENGFTIILRKDYLTEEYLRKLDLNERQIRAVMYVKNSGKISNRQYRDINKTSNKTAYLELQNLMEREIFIQRGKGMHITYILKSNEKVTKVMTK